MDYELFEYFTTDNISGKKCNAKWLSKNNSDLYNSIIKLPTIFFHINSWTLVFS